MPASLCAWLALLPSLQLRSRISVFPEGKRNAYVHARERNMTTDPVRCIEAGVWGAGGVAGGWRQPICVLG